MIHKQKEEHLSDYDLGEILVRDESDAETYSHDHLDSCRRCQQRLEHLAADDWWWSGGKQVLKSTARAMDLSTTEINRDGSVSNHESSEFVNSSQLLDSPSHPEMLGRLGDYDIERLIGSGGMGIVFKGFDRELNRPVAIKMLVPRLASNGAARRRFSREAKAAAAIGHENVVSIHRISSDNLHPYIVMPYIAGQSLQSFVDHAGPMEINDIVQIGMQIASGLAAAHEQGLVHRDVKPANILLENDCNRVLITDFGLARAEDDASLTRTGIVAGTPHYMSPEQADGKPIDARSDLFSLGSVMYFLATGRPPFRADSTMAVLKKICHEPVADLRDLNSEVPEPLTRVIHRLLEKDPSDRYTSATKVVDVLKSYLAHRQHPTEYRAPAIKRPGSLIRKRRRRAIAIGATTSVAVICGAVVWLLGGFLSSEESSGSLLKFGAQNYVTQPTIPIEFDDAVPAANANAINNQLNLIVSDADQSSEQLVNSSADDHWNREVDSIRSRIDKLLKEE
ncbi:serine/threonine protein kinase [Vicingaceae bacterium]|nr:serine/threonine protein kinase [Vicingaceae bacterium]